MIGTPDNIVGNRQNKVKYVGILIKWTCHPHTNKGFGIGK